MNSLLKTNGISVLALQETHTLSEETLDNLNSFKGYCMHIFYSSDPLRPNSKGVAIVLNKYLRQEVTTKILILGHAMLMVLLWHGNSKLNIVAIYAPNPLNNNAAFW